MPGRQSSASTSCIRIDIEISPTICAVPHLMLCRPGDITWHEDNWDNDDSRFLAFTVHDRSGTAGDLYAAFNAHGFQVEVSLPQPPSGKRWCRVVDTNLPSPRDFTPGGNSGVEQRYGVQAFSSILLIAK